MMWERADISTPIRLPPRSVLVIKCINICKHLVIVSICMSDGIHTTVLNKIIIENILEQFISLLNFCFQLQFVRDRMFIVTESCIIYTVL
jgi:hypothetical protein